MLQVVVVGLWHLGTVTAACLARLGHDVTGVDDDADRVSSLRSGRAPLFEPGLNDLLVEGITSRRLKFTTESSGAVPGADVVVIAHDTPVTDRDEADLSTLTQAVETLAPSLTSNSLLVIQSQVPVGTCCRVREALDGACEVAYVPENLRLGHAIECSLHPDMLVLGAESCRVHDILDVLFAGIDAPRIRTTLATAEMTKHAINAFLATSISFGNEFANLCQLVGADATQVTAALRRDRRIGPHSPIAPGMGFAGGTLARDVKILQTLGRSRGYPVRLIDAVLEVNESQNALPLRWLSTIYPSMAALHVAVLGLTYKVGTSTLRRSAALSIVRMLLEMGVRVSACDPKADLAEVSSLPPIDFTRDPYEAVSGTDALVLITPWPEFTTLDYVRVRERMRRPVVLDVPNALDKKQLEGLGYLYVSVGRSAPRRLNGL